MFARARVAENNPDLWAPIPTRPGPGYDAFWVAVLPAAGVKDTVVGVVGVGPLHPDMMPETMPYAQSLRMRQDFLELQHLRVDPDTRGQGIGQRLCQVVIDWTHERGTNMLLVNTTSPQHPARSLYRKLGFVETAVSFVGLYELVWMELNIS